MKNVKYIVLELICVAALVLFVIWYSTSNEGGTEKSVKEITEPVVEMLADSTMVKKGTSDAVKAFGIDPDGTEGILYWAAEDVMDVSEILIIKLADGTDAEPFKAAVEKRVADQENLYKNYAPDQYAVLQDSIIEISGNVLFYCASPDAASLYGTFKNAL